MKRKIRLDQRQLAVVLASLGNPHLPDRDPGDRGQRNDAGETATFAKKLEYVMTQLRDRKYPDLKARMFLPVSHEVPSGAESFVWRSYDYAGQAKIIANFADDIPLVDVLAGETSQILKSLADGYVYSIQDLRASSMAGVSLDQKRGLSFKRMGSIKELQTFFKVNAAVLIADSGVAVQRPRV